MPRSGANGPIACLIGAPQRLRRMNASSADPS